MPEGLWLTCPPRPAPLAQQHQRQQGGNGSQSHPRCQHAARCVARRLASGGLEKTKNPVKEGFLRLPCVGCESPETVGPRCCLKVPEAGGRLIKPLLLYCSGCAGGRAHAPRASDTGRGQHCHAVPIYIKWAMPVTHQGCRASRAACWLVVLINLGSSPAVSCF